MKSRMVCGCRMKWGFMRLPLRRFAAAGGSARGRAHLIPKNECAFDTGCHDTRSAIAGQVRDYDFRTHARAVMNQLGNEFRSAFRFRIANGTVPIQSRGPIRIRIEMTFQMRVEPLSD